MDLEDVKVSGRVDYVAGIKAGVLAGLVSLAFSFPVYLVSLYFRDLTGTLLFPRLVYVFIETDIPYSIVVGMILGIIFAATNDRFLKGLVPELKGMLYTMAYWLLVILPTILVQPLARQFFFSSASFPISVTGFLIFGLVLGTLYKRFSYGPHNTVS